MGFYITDETMTFINRNVPAGTLVRLTSGKHATVLEPHYGGYIWVQLNSGRTEIVHPDDTTTLPLI